MYKIYAECWRVLRPGGILALVLKGFTRSGQYQDLPGQTEALLLAAGWEKHDHWRRELWSLSFWRILQRRRDPAAYEAGEWPRKTGETTSLISTKGRTRREARHEEKASRLLSRAPLQTRRIRVLPC